ncbi:MAG: hypothetical protein M3R70_13725 [Actinomycetota bacterium]|nr:hypothetical protein [Actinomycetota bacterium]
MHEPRSILLLCDESQQTGNVRQHLAAFEQFSRHRIYTFNPIEQPRAAALLDLGEFDVVVLHYTLIVTLERYLPQALAEKIAAFEGLKVQFIQDEYRWVDAVTARMLELGIDLLYTCMPPDVAAQVYGPRLPEVTTVTTLAGYAPAEPARRPVLAPAERRIDVGYRGRDVPYWLGRLGRDKVEIGREFLARASAFDLRCDIAWDEPSRIYGEPWNQFLASCRATLGTESGASVVDFDGSIEARTRDYLVRRPTATFDEVEQQILEPYEDRVRIAVASPRIFEAAALRTAMILYSGGHSGVVEPGVHYIELYKDFSNLPDVVEQLRDERLLAALTGRAHADLIESGRYSLETFVGEFDQLVAERSSPVASDRKAAYGRAGLRRRLRSPFGYSSLREKAGRLLTPAAASALIARDPVVRRLSAAAGDGERLREDLWRLAALRRELRDGDAFHIVPSLESEGRLLFLESRAGPPPANGEAGLRTAVRAALEDGAIDEIVWNHSPVGATVPLLFLRLVPTPVGHHGIAGAHSFTSLVPLSRTHPALVYEALEPLLG